MEIERQNGPFTFSSGRIINVNGTPSRRWAMRYGDVQIAEKVVPGPNIVLSELFEAFQKDRAAVIRDLQKKSTIHSINLIDYANDAVVASFESFDMCGMTPGLINDSSDYWICSADGKYSRNVSLQDWGRIVSQHEAPEHAWIAAALPDDVMSEDAEAWRAPTSWELRHVVGEGSFTGVTGAKAAELVGVMPQNFRKYTARDDAASRQKISFAMWHLLLHKLGVKKA